MPTYCAVTRVWTASDVERSLWSHATAHKGSKAPAAAKRQSKKRKAP